MGGRVVGEGLGGGVVGGGTNENGHQLHTKWSPDGQQMDGHQMVTNRKGVSGHQMAPNGHQRPNLGAGIYP